MLGRKSRVQYLSQKGNQDTNYSHDHWLMEGVEDGMK